MIKLAPQVQHSSVHTEELAKLASITMEVLLPSVVRVSDDLRAQSIC